MPFQKQNIYFYVLVRARNSFHYFDRCINSVLEQKYREYTILYIDDHSKYTTKQINYIRQKLKSHVVVFNKERKYSLRNAYDAIHSFAEKKESVIVSLDGDDWLAGNNVFETLNKYYQRKNYVATYGNCYISKNKGISKEKASQLFEYCNIPYPNKVIKEKSYRKYPFLPLHLRTWKTSIFKKIQRDEFLDLSGNWLRFCEDQAIFFPILEMAGEKVKCISEPLSVYNMENIESDHKTNLVQQIKDEIIIRKRTTKKITLLTKSKIEIRHSFILSIPLLSNIIYKIQSKLIARLPVVYISLRESKARNTLLKTISKSTLVVIKFHKLGYQLHILKKNKICYDESVNLEHINQVELLDLMWTVVYSHNFSKSARKSLQEIFSTSSIVCDN